MTLWPQCFSFWRLDHFQWGQQSGNRNCATTSRITNQTRRHRH